MRGKISFIILFSFLILSGCERKIKSPTSPDENFFIPPTPKEVVLKVGNQSIDISWKVDDTSGIGGYRIYRADSSGITPTLYDSSRPRNILTGQLKTARHITTRSPLWTERGLKVTNPG